MLLMQMAENQTNKQSTSHPSNQPANQPYLQPCAHTHTQHSVHPTNITSENQLSFYNEKWKDFSIKHYITTLDESTWPLYVFSVFFWLRLLFSYFFIYSGGCNDNRTSTLTPNIVATFINICGQVNLCGGFLALQLHQPKREFNTVSGFFYEFKIKGIIKDDDVFVEKKIRTWENRKFLTKTFRWFVFLAS